MSRMDAVKPFLDVLRRPEAWIPGLRGRHLLVTIPVHVVAFALLYFGTMQIVRGEILRTHSTDARWLMTEAVRDLHPLMESHERDEVPRAVGEFAATHRLFDLKIYRSNGALMSSAEEEDPDVVTFLAGKEEESFHFDRAGKLVLLHGMIRLRSKDRCVECHEPAAVLGVATMRLDLTAQIAAADRRLRRNLATLIVAWALLVGALNIGLVALTRRSLARLHVEGSPGSPGASGRQEVPGLILDPVSAEIFDSLQKLLEHHRTSEAEVEGRLHHAERMASLGQIAAGLAHEIKNPLAGIRGVIEILGDDCVDDAQRSLYDQMVAELDRVNRTIHSLLSFARPSPPRRVPTDVRALIEDSVQLLRLNLEKRDIDLKVEIAPGVGIFELDPIHVRHVLVNLVSNAADAIGASGIIAVRATAFPDRDGLILAVEDDGPGIAEENQDEIFEPFYTTKFTGTGLGLAVVRSLVIRHGGRVELRSEYGRGATFFVLLAGKFAEVGAASTETEA